MHTLTDPPAGTAVLPDAGTFAADPQPRTLALGFTDDGREYFRIWVVNLLLTLATFGIYSAWAKVRRLQYFDRNTTLAGASFDFHGNPRAVLAGRLLSVVLLVAYHYAFGFSATFGMVVIAILLLAFPYLMRGALRFRLGNTSYRGLSLGFDGSVAQAYLAWLPPVFTFLMPGALLALYPEHPGLAALPVPLYLLWPLMHARIRRFQHAHLLFGDQHSRYAVKGRRFYRFYLVGGSLALLAAFSAGMAGGFAGAAAGNGRSATMFIMKLQARNALLTVLSLGLYRPFAVVNVYRYRLAHLHIDLDGDIDAAASRVATRGGAAGDSVADGFGIDLSW